MFKKVVWANDGSIVMERVLPVVKKVTEANEGARVVVAHVQEHLTIGRRAIFDDDHRSLDAALQQTVDALTAEGVDAELALIDGQAGQAGDILAELATEAGADLIVAGSSGHGPVAGFFQGSFTSHLLKAAACPVLLVPRADTLDRV